MAKKMTGKKKAVPSPMVVLETWKMPRTGQFGDRCRLVYDAKKNKVLTQVSIAEMPYYNSQLFPWEWPND